MTTKKSYVARCVHDIVRMNDVDTIVTLLRALRWLAWACCRTRNVWSFRLGLLLSSATGISVTGPSADAPVGCLETLLENGARTGQACVIADLVSIMPRRLPPSVRMLAGNYASVGKLA